MKKIKLFILSTITIASLAFSAAHEEAASEVARYPRNLQRSPADAIQRLEAEELVIIDDKAEFLPVMVDHTSYLPHFTIDQGNLGSCSACSLARSIDARSKAIGAPVINPAPLFIFHEAKSEAGTLENVVSGTSLFQVLQVVRTVGFCAEKTWPYDPRLLKVKPSAAAYEEASHHKVTDRPGIAWIGSNIGRIKYALANFLFPVFGMDIFESFEEARWTGHVPLPKPWDKRDGSHAMMLAGYDDGHKNSDGSLGAFIGQNSWGRLWGDMRNMVRGLVYIPYTVFERYSGDDVWAVNYISGAPEIAEGWNGIEFRPARADLRIPQPEDEKEKGSAE